LGQKRTGIQSAVRQQPDVARPQCSGELADAPQVAVAIHLDGLCQFVLGSVHERAADDTVWGEILAGEAYLLLPAVEQVDTHPNPGERLPRLRRYPMSECPVRDESDR